MTHFDSYPYMPIMVIYSLIPFKVIRMRQLSDYLEHMQFVERQEHIMDGQELQIAQLKLLLLIIVMLKIAVSTFKK